MGNKPSILTLYRICFAFLAIAVFGLLIYTTRQDRIINVLTQDVEYAVEHRADRSAVEQEVEPTKIEVEELLRQHGLEVDDNTVEVEYRERCELYFYMDDCINDLSVLDELPPYITLTSLDVGGTKVTDLSPLQAELSGELTLEELGIENTQVSSLAPVIGHPLRWIDISATHVTDLTPLKGSPLTSLRANFTRISDLTPLKGKRLEYLELSHTDVTDVSPLDGMPIKELNIAGTLISDLTPLQGMPVEMLNIQMTPVSDLTPIRDMNLYSLGMDLTKVSDLQAITGMQLAALSIRGTEITDLTPLEGMNLDIFAFEPWKIKSGIEIVRAMPNLRIISVGFENEYTYLDVAEFWRRYDNGEFLAGAKKWKTTEELTELFLISAGAHE